MQYIDKNLIIERYTSGSMSPAEVQNFHAMLEQDSELRAMFRAENLVNSTLNRDRVVLEAADHSRMYATFLKNLADSIPQAATASAATASSGGAAAWLAGISTSIKVAASALVVTGGIAAGVALYPSPEPQLMPVRQTEAPAIQTPAPSRADVPVVQPSENIAAPANTSRTDIRQLPNAGQPARSAEVQAPAAKDSIPEFNKNNVNIDIQAERE